VHANLFHLGHLHIPVFSAFAAVGLICALLLSQRTARLAGVAPEAMWDTGMAAAITALVVSRLLLIATNLKSFLSYPLLVLSLPSFTFSGVLLTALILAIYLRRKRLSLARVADAAAPCLALLWAILSLGSFATGSQGMPTTLPWAIDDRILGPIHPVEVYTASAALFLCVLLFRALSFSTTPGKTAATGLFLAGPIAFFLDFFTQPADPAHIVLLDPIQWLALAMALAGFFLLLPQLARSQPASNSETRPESTPHAV
jgi:phosphatidylglycerol:prolipoprotein diacylglycerol transferase